ncbi:Protein HEADING DATE REPRESSOR 1 [Camellia lanceoleosa]|uniref:Protein HEADING DATE REPRESSOR 1 n=1 Tax=Camellia lanceoleosa TaxID=1840588 RepID=A0ACC0F9C9_9ERIC|nr:Protein HEADING DATE REPRESSOR 1 [Camellia lanceoleosa]
MEISKKKMREGTSLEAFSPISSTPVFWKSRKRSASIRNVDMPTNDTTGQKQVESPTEEKKQDLATALEKQKESRTEGEKQDSTMAAAFSERRKALFEPLEPVINVNGKRPSAESLLPPPDFDTASYPRGWLIGKKRKLVNVDVVESMRRIAIQEMNRKDREIDGLNEQLEEDARCLEHLQLQLLEERSKRSNVERDNAMLQNQINMLMNMLQENETMDEEGAEEP